MNYNLFDIEQIDSLRRVHGKEKNFIPLRNNKIDGDYFATPPIIISELLKQEKLTGEIWEPACGEGHIAKTLIENGYNVYCSDLYNRGYGDQVNFLESKKVVDTIITNPPFDIIDSFLLQAKAKAKAKVIFICATHFLKGKKRINSFLLDINYPLTKVYMIDTAINFYRNGIKPKNKNGFMTSCCIVFEPKKECQSKGIELRFLQV